MHHVYEDDPIESNMKDSWPTIDDTGGTYQSLPIATGVQMLEETLIHE